MTVREYEDGDICRMREIWNAVVEDGEAFPQEKTLGVTEAEEFFGAQSVCGAAAEDGEVVGMYILHPNNVGRCGHICNASYAVDKRYRGQGIGEALVRDSMERAKKLGFGILQFNAVVADNMPARRLYESIGFIQLGTIEGGFRMKNGEYADICPYYIKL